MELNTTKKKKTLTSTMPSKKKQQEICKCYRYGKPGHIARDYYQKNKVQRQLNVIQKVEKDVRHMKHWILEYCTLEYHNMICLLDDCIFYYKEKEQLQFHYMLSHVACNDKGCTTYYEGWNNVTDPLLYDLLKMLLKELEDDIANHMQGPLDQEVLNRNNAWIQHNKAKLGLDLQNKRQFNATKKRVKIDNLLQDLANRKENLQTLFKDLKEMLEDDWQKSRELELYKMYTIIYNSTKRLSYLQKLSARHLQILKEEAKQEIEKREFNVI